ncbi:MAG: hypothetical protein EB060_11030 [Proteobacteria bacterium]|nr:hypothetical protein [Pseudomonadota bacterium]
MVRETAKDDWGMTVPSDEIDSIIDKADKEEHLSKQDGKIHTNRNTDQFNGLRTYSLSLEAARHRDRSILFVVVAGGNKYPKEIGLTFFRTHRVLEDAFIGTNADIYANDKPIMRRETEFRPSKPVGGTNLISSRTTMLTLDEFRSIFSKDDVIRITVGNQAITISKRDTKRIREWLAGVEESEKDEKGN